MTPEGSEDCGWVEDSGEGGLGHPWLCDDCKKMATTLHFSLPPAL